MHGEMHRVSSWLSHPFRVIRRCFLDDFELKGTISIFGRNVIAVDGLKEEVVSKN